jgi:hypothetical protein
VNPWLAVAACLALFLGAAHSYLGERVFFVRLFRRGPTAPLFEADGFARRILRFVWHLTTVAWWGAAALIWALGRGEPRTGLHVLAATFLASGIVTAIGSRGRHLAWLVFLAIAAAAWLGAR